MGEYADRFLYGEGIDDLYLLSLARHPRRHEEHKRRQETCHRDGLADDGGIPQTLQKLSSLGRSVMARV